MVETLKVLERFEETIDSYATKSKASDIEKIVGRIDIVSKQAPAIFAEDKMKQYLHDRNAVMTSLVTDYFTAALGQKYVNVSNELFDLKRHLVVDTVNRKLTVFKDYADVGTKTEEYTGNKKVIDVPLFVYVPLDSEDKEVTLAKYGHTRRNSWGNSVRSTTTIKAKLPGEIGASLKMKMREALDTYYKVLSKAYSNDIIGEMLLQNTDLEEKLRKPEIGATWIPTVSSLKMEVSEKTLMPKKPIDPAMLMRVLDKNYLITTWLIDDEEPFEKYLEAYSIKKN